MAVALITHDLALVSGRTDDVAVMYAGRIVERAPTPALFAKAAHPYTLGLLSCRPRIGGDRRTLPTIGGQVSDPAHRPDGCAFHPRCPFATDQCRAEVPLLEEIEPGHEVACFEASRVRERGEWPHD